MHPRLVASGDEHLVLDHYLEILARKPGALPGSVPLAQARADGSASPRRTRRCGRRPAAKLGDGAGTRALIEVLLLHRRLPAASVTAGIEAALRAGTCSPDVVAVEARRHAAAAGAAAAEPPGPAPRRSRAAVVTLPRRAGPLPADPRPLPDVAAYDQLLRLAPRPEEGSAS